MLCLQVLSRAALAVHDCERLPEFSRTLDCSVPGPQVRTRPRQLEVGGTRPGFPRQQEVVEASSHSSHIYMEVDPLYSIMAEPGVVSSSTSSQTSSGYSTAPSDTQRLSGLGGGLYECGEAEYEAAQDSRGTRGFNINSISQACEFHQTQRNSQRQKKPELVMNNILLQQTNREIL